MIIITKMWLGIPLEEMCDQHLLGLHKKLHQEVSALLNQSIMGYQQLRQGIQQARFR